LSDTAAAKTRGSYARQPAFSRLLTRTHPPPPPPPWFPLLERVGRQVRYLTYPAASLASHASPPRPLPPLRRRPYLMLALAFPRLLQQPLPVLLLLLLLAPRILAS